MLRLLDVAPPGTKHPLDDPGPPQPRFVRGRPDARGYRERRTGLRRLGGIYIVSSFEASHGASGVRGGFRFGRLKTYRRGATEA